MAVRCYVYRDAGLKSLTSLHELLCRTNQIYGIAFRFSLNPTRSRTLASSLELLSLHYLTECPDISTKEGMYLE